MGAGCGQSQAEKEAALPVTLQVWSVFEDQDAFEELMNAYRTVHSNVSFNMKLLRYDEYEDELLQAFARGEGPDIFSIHNTWLGEYKDLITPLPASLSIPYTETTGTIKKETVTTLREEKAITQQELKNNYVDVVSDDLIQSYQPDPNKDAEDKIFAIPLYVDTLVLYSNTDILNSANIAEPPATWQLFQDQVKLITKVNTNGDITQSAAAFGAGENVERSMDILSVLMMQNGTVMEKNGKAVFSEQTEDRRTPSSEALSFYSAFANPVKDVYTWNSDMTDSFDAFVNGETAFFFGYAYHLPLIKQQASKLEYRISALPQIENGKNVNFANYWAWTVSKASNNSKWAWDFIQYAAKKENVSTYLENTVRPTALRGLIAEQSEDDDLGIFANQLLTAESWYHGNNANVVEEAFISLIDSSITSGLELGDLIREAENKVNQTY
jgi:ABC-type glycerol-3-phosphate transport system substrate-binding protein